MHDSSDHKEAEASSTGYQAGPTRGQLLLHGLPSPDSLGGFSLTFRIGKLSDFTMPLAI